MTRLWSIGLALVAFAAFATFGLRAGEPDPDAPATYFRPGPKPPARAAERVELPFPPPPGQRPAAPRLAPVAQPLSVVHHGPEGAEQRPGQVSVTFNQPMVPVSSLGELKGIPPPLRLEPEVAGSFHWMGTETIVFRPDKPLPLATRFQVVVPAGTRSASGQALAGSFAFSFDTPRPVVSEVEPFNGSTELGLELAVLLTFDQPVSVEKVAAHVSLTDEGGGAVPLRSVPRSAWASEPRLSGYLGYDGTEQMAAFVPAAPLRPNTRYRIRVQPGLVGDAGPLPLVQAFESGFSTYGPFTLQHLTCGGNWGEGPVLDCPLDNWLGLQFNHEVAALDLARLVSVSPRPAGLKLSTQGFRIRFEGRFQADRDYTVRLKPGARDAFGQVLEQGFSGKVHFVHLDSEFTPLNEEYVVMERGGGLRLPVGLENVDVIRVTAYRLPESEWWAGIRLQQRAYDQDELGRELKRLARHRVDGWSDRPRLKPDVRGLHELDLRGLVGRRGPGVYLLVLEPQWRGRRVAERWPVLVQLTDLGLTVRSDSRQMVVLATSIASGRSRPGVRLRLLDEAGKSRASAVSGRDGLAVLRAGEAEDASALLLVAAAGADRSFVTIDGSGDDGSYTSFRWGRPESGSSLRTFLYPERDVFRPREPVRVFGLARRLDGSQLDRLGPLPSEVQQVRWRAQSARGREVAAGTAALSSLGAFDLAFDLPADIDLGQLSVSTELLSPEGQNVGSAGLALRVEEYRAPEFEVAVSIERAPLFESDSLPARVRGRYLHGAPMKGAEVSWNLFGDPARFSAPGCEAFHFGSAPDPWWWYERSMRHWRVRSPIASGSGRLDAEGELRLETPLQFGLGLDPLSLTLEAQVVDLSRQSVAGRASALVYPADRGLGLRLARDLIEVGAAVELQLLLVDLDGRRQAGVPIEVRLVPDGSFGDSEPDPAKKPPTCRVASAVAPQVCRFTPQRAGRYLIEARASDSRGRPVGTDFRLWVSGPGEQLRDQQAERLELIPDRRQHQVGETAEVLVRAPFASGLVLVTEERRGLLGHRLLRLKNHMARVQVTMQQAHIPGLFLSATAIAERAPVRGKRPRAAWASGTLELPISPDAKRLAVGVQPAKAVARPGERLAVVVQVSDAAGQPVPQATVSLMAVDEAVLGMTGFATPDPLPFFYFRREAGAALAETLKRVLVELTREQRERGAGRGAMPCVASKSAEMAAGEDAAGPAGGAAGAVAVAVRRLFVTTPLAVRGLADARGQAHFELPLPDNLTRYRLMAAAADAVDRFGSGEAAVTAQRPLQVRPALPRFLNTGDRFQAGAVIDNQTATAGRARVRLEVEGAKILGPAEAAADVASGGTAAVAFEVHVPRPGPIRLRFSAELGAEADAVEISLPVWTPATAEAFAAYGTTMDSTAQPIRPPVDALAGFGGLTITLASTALTGLQDAARYLIDYPYGCVEQTASRVLPALVMGDILETFGIQTLGTAEQRRSVVGQAVRRLLDGQRSDGGWSTWPGSVEPRADLTAWVLFILHRAQEAGFPVPDEARRRAAAFLRGFLDSAAAAAEQQPERSGWLLDLQASALYSLTEGPSLAEQRDAALGHAQRLLPLSVGMDLFAQAMLAAVMHRLEPGGEGARGLLRSLLNHAIQTPAAARFAEQAGDHLRLLMHSDSRTDAIALLALVEIDPQHVLVPKVVRGLLDARVRGCWETTQANAWALAALAGAFKALEAAPTEFTASLWLGEGYLGGTSFVGRSMQERSLQVPMRALAAVGPTDLILAKDGPGRLYYRVGLTYAPKSFALPAADEGFAVARRYEALENPDDVGRDEQGRWRIRAGATVRIHLEVKVPDRRFYVSVDDPLPAGLELVNLAFRTSARDALGDAGDPGWLGYWISWYFVHRELRDERSLHFADELPPGTYHLAVLARATTPGEYIVPPARAEEMYRPEVFGRSRTDWLVVR